RSIAIRRAPRELTTPEKIAASPATTPVSDRTNCGARRRKVPANKTAKDRDRNNNGSPETPPRWSKRRTPPVQERSGEVASTRHRAASFARIFAKRLCLLPQP